MNASGPYTTPSVSPSSPPRRGRWFLAFVLLAALALVAYLAATSLAIVRAADEQDLKPADAIVPDGGTVPYPPLTKDMHHEVELVVALSSGGRNIRLERALDCIFGYGVGIDLTRRDLQIASRDMKRPWEIGKAFDASAPCGPLQPATRIGHPSRGRIALKVNGQVRQDGDLAQMIWNVPEVIVKLSEMVELAAGDVIMTGTPSGVAATVAGDKLECEIAGVGKLTVTIGQPAA